jgi:hypothetical protein
MKNILKLLGGHTNSTAAVYLRDYLRRENWPAPFKFSRGAFGEWLKNDTRAEGAYGCDYVLKGFDGLVASGFITRNEEGFEVTEKFIEAMKD